MEPSEVVFDAAGGNLGGAARWHRELSSYIDGRRSNAQTIGDGKRLTPRWLVERERLARHAKHAIAPNNASFVTSGLRRTVIMANALHYLYPDEQHLLHGFSKYWRTQIPVVRALASRADKIVAPSTAMADRLIYHAPRLKRRVFVRPHPVSSSKLPRRAVEPQSILVPVVPGPYKNLVAQLRRLLDALEYSHHRAIIHVTATEGHLPSDIANNPRVHLIGIRTHKELLPFWQEAWAVFYPSTTESFGFPLAEARVLGLPVLAPETAHATEIAGNALRGYNPADTSSIVDALSAANSPPYAEPDAFDPSAYFDWLIDA